MTGTHAPRTSRLRLAIAASILSIATSAIPAFAQTSAVASTDDSHSGVSSSTDWKAYLSDDMPADGSAAPAASAAGGQYGQYPRGNNRYPGYESQWSHVAIEAGAGFTAPVGNTTNFSTADIYNGYLSPNQTFGYNINVGGGWNFTKRFGALLEYSWNRNKIPGSYTEALYNIEDLGSYGYTSLSGNVNTWSFTIDPIFYLPFSKKNGAYVTGGGGFYRKVTNFTEPVTECYYYCYDVGVTVAHYSSNQGGLNLGVGFYRKVFGEDSNAKLYAEARYVWVDSPGPSASNYYNGSGTESLIPVTFGIRF
ncbi:hypothetical protein [Silvibacterium dinghuense]|uniref:Outer membrane protein beta-barrel domain-containing protein n=1 Tax=Silvibacterium dinghuense TaxID=1560006 RepID=A0A4Q1SIK8_9BACT|nr:hypothetical protein [Silvibacterium dinghuense]RXS97237.1 hypothetical protein ESZ00_04805 [Silvibacterium dinghuense]GGG97343.1 hypothetical protein GCM10011586_10770 [Silvibacterium dinghuense]